MKKFLAVAGATVLTLSMAVTALADPVNTDQDYGAEGQFVENATAWGSNLNGQFAIEDNQSVTFTYKSKSADTSNAVFGWVSEITDGTNYITVTQGGTGWTAGTDWTDVQIVHEKSWEDDAVYATASAELDVTLVVTRKGNQVVFDSTAKATDGTEYKLTSTGVWAAAPEGTLQIQLGVDHGSMNLYTVKFAEAGEIEEATTIERITLKPSMNAPGVSADTATDDAEEESSSSPVIIVVVAVVVVAVVAGVLVATKKKK